MIKEITYIIYGTFLAGILLVTLGCSEREASDAGDASVKYAAGQLIGIVFYLPGDDIGSKDDRVILKKISIAFTENGVADIVRTGFGMGKMEVTIRARTELSGDAIDRIILEEYPGAKYRKDKLKE